DHRTGPRRRIDVAVLLPVEGVGLVEGDLVPPLRQSAQDAAIIGRRAVPVRGEQAGAVEGDLAWACRSVHAIFLAGVSKAVRPATMSSSSSARWAQVWRRRIVSSPAETSDCRSAGSSRSHLRWRAI